ncbi:regulatory protein GemA [Labrenzia sp. PHM005]|uniref:regulatory protein GemA n=1 Tax=Labrenzia sp. PHM005 TaxID=2590016 RepID=UPI00113FD7A2|nr:regulatory protein GemA [Labrenzia sp. PHM005]QDG74436.1 regulatory protein GemA [Labrenzia sp. PHM005]
MTALQQIHLLKRKAGFDEDTYRDFLEKHTGERSSKDMTDGQRLMVISELRKLVPEEGRKRAPGKYAKKLQALWIAAYNLGVVDDKTDKAMIDWLKRQTGLDHHRFLRNEADANKAIDALKLWIRRATGCETLFTRDRNQPPILNDFRFQICLFLWTELAKEDCQLAGSLDQHLRSVSGKGDASQLSSKDWITAMNQLGQLYRSSQV